jgi:Ran GTPase-activating protein (RanGAP) involved in mRNA processing and transport
MTTSEEDAGEWLHNLCRHLYENDADVTEVDIRAPAGHIWSDSDSMVLSDSLRKNDQVTRLSLRNLELSKQGALIMGPAIKNSTSLLTLELEDCPDSEGHVADVLAMVLFYNRTIQTLHVRGSWDDPSQAFSLGFLLHTATLSELRICHNQIDASLARVIASGLKTNTSLRILDLADNGMDDEAVAEIAAGLAHNETNVEFVSLDFNAFGDDGVATLSQMLAVNSTVTELHLFGNRVSAIGAEYLADALRTNETLQSLILSFNRIGDRGAVALAQALTVNTTLTKIWFPSNAIGFEGMQAFADFLPRMKGLEQLNVGLLLHDETKEALVQGLKGNLRLSVLEMEEPIYEELEDVTGGGDMDFYLRLNRSGRRLIQDPRVRPELWAKILARTQEHKRQDGTPDVLYYLLREKPELLDLSCR